MSKIWVKKISHPGGTETFQGKDLKADEWTDIFIRSGASAADVDDFNKRIEDWEKERTAQGDEVIWVPNH